ncbi:phage holin family protein [Serratia fonticola]|jgi:hypothetical protein|uniref:phage holin family protein n=1 Tax=Serratia fonticola TaxID=47917 RepID=UPI00192D0C0C|nr:phage holin family protein [Serratia fonticola]MBL5825399.1 phage holin family protein [Serratia fonticola]HBE9082113.1 phage holin family protein [Serratia fonticola]HBE9090972.1 phage holin family protein [Serratia fonticola]
MSEPISGSGAAAATVTGVTLVGLFSNLDPAVVIGAFAGAAVFVMSSSEFSLLKKIWMFVLSFLTGMFSAAFFADVIEACLSVMPGNHIEVDDTIGALVGGAVAVRLLMMLIAKSSDPNALDIIRRRGGPDE